MADVWLSSFAADTDPPFVTNEDPAPGATLVLRTADVQLRVDDLDTGVDLTTVTIEIDSGSGFVLAYDGGAGGFQAGFSGTATPAGTDGYDFFIDPDDPFPGLTTITVRVNADDNDGNSLVDHTYSFQTRPEEAEEVEVIPPLPLDMYRFIIFEIRRQDLQGSPRPGSEFLRRYLQGPQDVWAEISYRISTIPRLWDVEEIKDKHLSLLKNILGWTSETQIKKITDALDDDALRRLIAASGRLWKTRGPEDAILNVLTLVTGGARMRIWNWFDFRWVLDETELGEEHEGRDPWVVNLPSSIETPELVVDSGTAAISSDGVTITATLSSFNINIELGHIFRLTSGPLNGQEAPVLSRLSATQLLLQGTGVGSSFTVSDWEVVDQTIVADDEYRSNLRIVDDGTLDRNLVKRVLRLMRASGERWNITYLDFLDRFLVEGDDLQWEPIGGENLDVSSGKLNLLDTTTGEETFAIVSTAANWTQYVVAARIRGTSNSSGALFGILFYYQDDQNHYRATIDTVAKELKITVVQSGTPTDLATLDLNAALIDLLPGVWYLLRVSIVNDLPNHQIAVSVDGAELLTVTTTRHFTKGTVGFRHDTDAQLEVDEVEVFELPVDDDELNINEFP